MRSATLSWLILLSLPFISSCAKTEESAIISLEDVRDATVQITCQGTFADPEFGLVYNLPGNGSGFIIDPSGLAVTNNHVVTGAAFIEVLVGGEGDRRSASVLGASECSDLAVIKIEGEDFAYLRWYESEIDVGLEVYAAGYPLGDVEFTLTRGVVSKEKASGDTEWSSLKWVLEHDARLAPGNSGGPLVTQDGRVVGVNFAASSLVPGQNFAIPAEISRAVIESLLEEGNIDSIGINGMAFRIPGGEDVKEFSGIWVSSVDTGSPADAAGIEPGDILVTLEDLLLATDGTLKDYCRILRSHQDNSPLSFTLYRPSNGLILGGQLWGTSEAQILESPYPAPSNAPGYRCEMPSWVPHGAISTSEIPDVREPGPYEALWICGTFHAAKADAWPIQIQYLIDCTGHEVWVYFNHDPAKLPPDGAFVCVLSELYSPVVVYANELAFR